MRGIATCLTALTLIGCSARTATPEERAEDVAEETARQTARSVATEVSADQYREIDERLDRLEDTQRHILITENFLINEDRRLENNSKSDDDQIRELRNSYNDHLRASHGAR